RAVADRVLISPRRESFAPSRHRSSVENGSRMTEPGDNLVAGVPGPMHFVNRSVNRGNIGFGACRHVGGQLLTPEKDHVRGEAAMPAYPGLHLWGIDVHHVLGGREAYRLAAERCRLPCRMKA